jgi:bacteriorhodopsin
MSDIAKRAHDALHTNPNVFHYPDTSQINITTHGSDIYWAVAALMAFSTVGFIAWSSKVQRPNRTFHYITAAITLVASIAYFTMASNLGYAAIIVEFMRSNPKVAGTYREVFYVRYIDWFVTTPVSIPQTPSITTADHFHSFSFWIYS